MRTREKMELEKIINNESTPDWMREYYRKCLESNIYPFKKEVEKSNKISFNEAAVILGRKGGKSTSEAKKRASRENGKKHVKHTSTVQD